MSDLRDRAGGMPYSDKEVARAYQRRWYQENRKKRADTRRRNQLRIKSWFEELRLRLRCVRCGESHPACITFHHRDPATKEFEVSVGVARSKSIARIEREMAKCDVLCVNCHLVAHADERRPSPRDKHPERKKGSSPYAMDP